MEEKWKDIKGYEGMYQVSNTGKIRSLDRIVKDANKNRYQHLKGKELKFTDNGRGYKLVFLTKNSKRMNKYVHRLVAEAFIPNPKNLPEINHKNLNKADNCIENLEWLSNEDNKRHYQKTPIAKVKNKQKATMARNKYYDKIKDKIPFIIEDYVKYNHTVEFINKKTGIGKSMISRILKENGIPINANKRERFNISIKRDKLGRFMK